MSRIAWAGVAALAGLLLAGACGGDDDAGASSDGVTGFFAAADEALCGLQVRCGTYPDVATCRAVSFPGRDRPTDLALVEAGTIVFDAAQAAACLDFIDGFSCDPVAINPTGKGIDNACAGVLTGTVAVGGACVVDEACVPGSACRKPSSCASSDTCCAGACVALVTDEVPLGGDCSQNDRCVAGSYCPSSGTTRVCSAQLTTEGAACDAFDACAAPLVCAQDLATGMGACYEPAAHGAACDPGVFFGACAQALDYCNSVSKTCTAFARPGEPCGGAAASECIAYAECTGGTCAERPVAGGTCGGGKGAAACLGDLECTSSVCTAPAAATACP